MATKKTTTPSMADVTSSDKVTPSASGRPIIVSNHSVLPNDPMVVGDEAASTDAAPASTPVISRQAKTIVPISHDLAPETETADEPAASAETTAPEPAKEDSADAPEPVAAEKPSKKVIEPQPAEPEPEAAKEDKAADASAPAEKTDDDTADESADQDTEATAKDASPEADKKLAAAEARERELEAVIESGKYAVPINVEHNNRSALSWLLWALLVIVVVAVALDLLLDAGMLTLQVPHTNFLNTYKP